MVAWIMVIIGAAAPPSTLPRRPMATAYILTGCEKKINFNIVSSTPSSSFSSGTLGHQWYGHDQVFIIFTLPYSSEFSPSIYHYTALGNIPLLIGEGLEMLLKHPPRHVLEMHYINDVFISAHTMFTFIQLTLLT